MDVLPLPPFDQLEATLASEVCMLLEGVPIGQEFEMQPSEEMLFSLELFVPRLLATRVADWMFESLDGFFVARAVKKGPTTAELAGTCILITDQAVTPFKLELRIGSPDAPFLKRVRIRIGEPGRGKLGISGPSVNSRAASKLLAGLLPRIESVSWSYDLIFCRRGRPGASG
jgi:hypothetical protein